MNPHICTQARKQTANKFFKLSNLLREWWFKSAVKNVKTVDPSPIRDTYLSSHFQRRQFSVFVKTVWEVLIQLLILDAVVWGADQHCIIQTGVSIIVSTLSISVEAGWIRYLHLTALADVKASACVYILRMPRWPLQLSSSQLSLALSPVPCSSCRQPVWLAPSVSGRH